VSLDEALAHLRTISAAVELPINADLEGGFAVEAEAVATNVTAATATGVAGLSIEDSTGDAANPLFDFALSVERIRAARRAIDDSGTGVLLTARCETYLIGRPDLGEAIRRLAAYAEAGADCLYAPGIRDFGEIKTLVDAVAPEPVNVLVGSGFATVDQLRDLGVRRISVGSALARAAWGGFLAAAREIAEHGTFEKLAGGAPFAELNERFS
jgi:methylisocitrate lyase